MTRRDVLAEFVWAVAHFGAGVILAYWHALRRRPA